MEQEVRTALIAALRLQLDWGADEALADLPLDRTKAPAAGPSASPLRGGEETVAAPHPPIAPPDDRSSPRLGAFAPAVPGSAAAKASELAASAVDLRSLRAAVAAFEQCGLRETATNLVFAATPERARVMLVGDVPGADDDRTGRPFAGPQGAFLDGLLGSIGLDRATVRLAMLLPWRPPGGRPPSDTEIRVCLPFLHRQIALTAPSYLLLTNGPAVAALVGGPGRRSRRNQAPAFIEVTIPECATIPALILPSLSMMKRSGAAKRDAWSVLCLLRNTLDR